MVLKNHTGLAAPIRAVRPTDIGNYGTHETGFVTFLKMYTELGLINRRTISDAADRKITDFLNMFS